MAGFKIALEGVEELENRLNQLNSVRWEAVRKKQTAQMLNRARQSGGTPVSTEKTRPKGPHGELRQSSSSSGEEVGYTKEYGPHVEYGHRTVNGGFVLGQRFLQRNVETQRKIYKKDLLDAIRKEQ